MALVLLAWGLFAWAMVPSLQYRAVSLAGPGGALASSLPVSAVYAGIAFGSFAGGVAIGRSTASAAVLTGLITTVLAILAPGHQLPEPAAGRADGAAGSGAGAQPRARVTQPGRSLSHPVILTDLEDIHDLEDTMTDLSATTTIVVGASRGLGRGIATALAEAGAPVVAVSRTAAAFPQPANGAGTIQPEVADAADATVAASLLDRYEPQAVILVAGAAPHMGPLQQQTWETFSVNWQADVRITFTGCARRC